MKTRSVKRLTYLIDNYGCKCFWCKKELLIESMHIEHLTPRSKGGSNDLDNLRPSCQTCNSYKHDKSIIEWRKLAVKKLETANEAVRRFSNILKTIDKEVL